MIRIKVPATSANLGPGFDCLGLALNLYNIIEVYENVDNLLEENLPGGYQVEKDDDNLIYKSIKGLYDYVGCEIPSLKIAQKINIPMSRGLGSSAACIVGGLVAANEMLKRPLDTRRLLELANEMEGHPDNVAPALLGGLVVSACVDGSVKYVRHPIKGNIKLMALIPDFTLSTHKAREVLPSVINYKDAVFNVGRSSLLTASLITGNLENIKYAVEDKLHQPYRIDLIPEGEKIKSAVYEWGGDAFFISGSGSTLMALVSSEDTVEKMRQFCSGLKAKWTIKLLEIDNVGAKVM